MGSCISKCQPKPKPYSNIPSSVQDKLVIISQSPPSSPRKRKTIQSPPSIDPSSSSLTCSTTQTNTCCSSSLSTTSSSSSALISKVDRSFSNDFLHTCALENPQVVGLHHVKKSGELSTLKRARASSPTITRQKSFRIEKEKPLNTMRSPSPSRRFNTYNNTSSSYHQRQPMLVLKNIDNETNHIVKGNSRAASPYRNVINKEREVYLKNKERFGYEVGQVLSKMDYSKPVPMEDLDNPHIALDCFIFL